jgi:hypothetical protein
MIQQRTLLVTKSCVYFTARHINAARRNGLMVTGNRDFGGGSCGMGKIYFYKLFSGNSTSNGVLSRGFFTFYFLPLGFIFSLSGAQISHDVFAISSYGRAFWSFFWSLAVRVGLRLESFRKGV